MESSGLKNDSRDIFVLIDALNSDQIGICLDTGHLATEYCTNVEEQVLLVKDEPIIYTPTELDPTMATPTPVPEGYIPSEEDYILKASVLLLLCQ